MTRKSGCPICGKPAVAAAAPFCSQGCRDRDLLQWLSDGYRLPAHSADPPGDTDGLDSPGDRD
ncbi:DNA gyrase inhibitor YacG [Sphingomonas bacterium]|uniref:DNA gyrase inhibitor YacG n=1 Tax=Sphingomonas bacterium TaxID=1895847 RepID=UPI0015769BC1|nr:DNA gyrase inhibitor YacG [Sphingomonas bacterium]